MGQRLKSRSLLDLAYQVALIRPGVGVQGSAVSQFVDRYRHGAGWEYDHPLEARALERGCGIIVWQEQVVQLIKDVAGMTAAEADEIRRAFARPNADHLVAMHRRRFLEGAATERRSPRDRHQDIRQDQRPLHVPGVSLPRLRHHRPTRPLGSRPTIPLEFFVTLMNNQPMGFYPIETIKQDARRFGVPFMNPCVNRSDTRCVPDSGAVRLGLEIIKDVGAESARLIVEERERHGPYASAGDLVSRTGLKPQSVLSLVMAGAFDGIAPNRREALWGGGTPPPAFTKWADGAVHVHG